AERVPRDIRAGRILERLFRVGRVLRPVIEARGDDPDRARHELRGTRAFRAVTCHVVELAVPAEREPALEPGLVFAKIDAADADLAEAERGGIVADPVRERGEGGGGQRA